MDFCSSCHEDLEDGGTPFQDCEHLICWICLNDQVSQSSSSHLKCGVEDCDGFLGQEEIKCLVTEEIYDEYVMRIEEREDDAEDLDSIYDSASASESEFHEVNTQEQYEETRNIEDDASGWGQLAEMMKRLQFQGMTSSEAQKELDKKSVYITNKTISCGICLSDTDAGDGIIIKDCLHMFCRECLTQHIGHSDTVEVECPHAEDEYKCDSNLKPRELKQLCSSVTVYRKHYEELSLRAVEDSQSMVHCLTPNCKYFCEVESDVLRFQCLLCKEENCLVCRVIHTGMSCDQYIKKIEAEDAAIKQAAADESNRQVQRQNDILSQDAIQRKLMNQQLRACPQCGVMIEKNLGCDHMTCTKCRHEFLWSTGADYRSRTRRF